MVEPTVYKSSDGRVRGRLEVDRLGKITQIAKKAQIKGQEEGKLMKKTDTRQ